MKYIVKQRAFEHAPLAKLQDQDSEPFESKEAAIRELARWVEISDARSDYEHGDQSAHFADFRIFIDEVPEIEPVHHGFTGDEVSDEFGFVECPTCGAKVDIRHAAQEDTTQCHA